MDKIDDAIAKHSMKIYKKSLQENKPFSSSKHATNSVPQTAKTSRAEVSRMV